MLLKILVLQQYVLILGNIKNIVFAAKQKNRLPLYTDIHRCRRGAYLIYTRSGVAWSFVKNCIVHHSEQNSIARSTQAGS